MRERGDFDLGVAQGRDPISPRELRTLIGIHDLGCAVSGHGLIQSLDAKAGIQRVGEPM